MTKKDIAGQITRRSAEARLPISEPLTTALAAYLELLAHWNRTINLTALGLDPLTNEAIDRLILEPLAVARHVRPDDRLAVDIGSGGGSPAIPLKLAVPALQMVLVESRTRKAAFLREVVRELSLESVVVENERSEQLATRAELHGKTDLVTIRAVRTDEALLKGAVAFLKPGGRVFWLTALPGAIDAPAPLKGPRVETLLPSGGSRLAILSTPVNS